MVGVFAAFGAALLAATEIFTFLMGLDGVVFTPYSALFNALAVGSLLISLGSGVWVFRSVYKTEKGLAASVPNV